MRKIRNKTDGRLRTPFMLTYEQQQEFYKNIVCNRDANARYYSIKNDNDTIGMCGLENISFINGLGEISIIIDSEVKGNGFGEKAIELLLLEGFNKLRLQNIYGECYFCNTSINFWEKIIKKYNGSRAILEKRKFFNGKFYDSLYFNLNMNRSGF